MFKQSQARIIGEFVKSNRISSATRAMQANYRKLLRHLALASHRYSPDTCPLCAKIADELAKE